MSESRTSEPGSIGVLAAEQWDPSLEAIVADMQGRPINLHGLLANHPDLLEAWWGFRQYVVAGGKLGRRNAELVILRTSVHRGSWYEWASHVVRGRSCGLSLTDIERVFDGPDAAGWREPDAALVAAVDELDAHGALSPTSLTALGRHFDAQQILDLVAIHGTYAMLAMMLRTWQVSLDERVEAALPESVTERRFVEKAGPG